MVFAETIKSYASKLPTFSEAIDSLEAKCVHLVNESTEFLDTHPGIATLLSPGTVLRRVAQKHTDERINYNR